MRIVMFGAGAMGGIYGGLLALDGCDVTFVDTRPALVETLRRDGLRLEGVRGDHVIRTHAATDVDGLAPADLVIVFTDSNGTADAARMAAQVLKPEGFALTLQNGIGNVETLSAVLGASRVVAGVSMNSGMSPAPGCSRFTNAGVTAVGELDGRDTQRIRGIARMLGHAGLEAAVVSDAVSMIWSKFVLNCGVNVLSAVTGLRLGEISRTPAVDAIQDRVIDEILAVVQAKGVTLTDPDPRGSIKDICRKRFNKPSMLQHVEAGRRTEIDAINGALVREAHALGVPVPVNETLVAVLKGLEKSRQQALHGPELDYAAMERAAAGE